MAEPTPNVPGRDERLRKVAAAVALAGVEPELIYVVAEGVIARLRRRVFERLDDRMGDTADLIALSGWTKPPDGLIAALEAGEYIDEEAGAWFMIDAVNEAPEYVRKRWRRYSRPSYDAAMKRADNHNVLFPVWEQDDQPETAMPYVKPPAKPRRTSGEKHGSADYNAFRTHWEALYRERVNPAGYVWNFGADGRIIHELLNAVGLDGLKGAAKRFVESRDPWYAGHELWKLRRHINRFTGGQPAQRTRGAEYASTVPTESLIKQ
jgi:hypothetical protein